jgi:hydrogenase/urease accessory protein HupE
LPDRRAAGGLALAAALLPGPAVAHSPIRGIEGFYVGLLHPLTSAGQILALLALGLFFGQRWPRHFGLAWAIFAGACLGGILLGQMGVPADLTESGLLALALATSGLAALRPGGVAAPGIAAAGIAGLLLGLASTPDPGPLRATVITLTGSLTGAVVALLYAAGGLGWLHERATRTWARMGFRIAAAWSAAIAALLLALSVAGPR